MRSVKLVVEGCYWDSQIYSGELLLFGDDNEIHRIGWREVIDRLAEKNSNVQTAVRVAFSDSDLFYNSKVQKILLDPHIAAPIKKQLADLAVLNLTATRQNWSPCWRVEGGPFNFLPTDTEVYYDQLFAAGDDGLFSAARSSLSAGRVFEKKVNKHHDARILQVRASDRFTSLAVAAGDDGLFEFPFLRADDEVLDQEKLLAKRPCSACDWAFQSVMGWSAGEAFMASFKQEKEANGKRIRRVFDRIVDSGEFFGEVDLFKESVGQTWGCREKIYRVSGSGLEVANYSHMPEKSKKNEQSKQSQFRHQGSFSLDFDASASIATGTAPFGTVLEFDDRLVVVRSDGGVDVFTGEPVHWRVFPRSEHYSNQLHIIYDDRIEIVSFVHDYFVNQSDKLSGFRRGAGDLSGEG